jgi:hypothetical protein
MPKVKHKHTPIDLSSRVIFLHIAKTAGTSIIHFFRQRLPQDSVCSHGDFLSLPKDDLARQQALKQFKFLSGHFGYDDVAALLPEAYSFTFLRDPVDRVLSFYKFCMHPDMQRQFAVARAARELGLDGFLASKLPEVVEAVDNSQTWQLARSYWQADREALGHYSNEELLQLASTHLGQFSHIGLTETFDEDLACIMNDLGIKAAIPQKRQFVTSEPILRDSLKPATLAMLQERVALDYQLLEMVRDKRTSTH